MLLLWVATLVSIVTFFVHLIAGGKAVAGPLLESDALPAASKWLNYYCWHVTTILIAYLALAFGLLALTGGNGPAILILSSLTSCLSVLSAVVALKGGISPLRFPSTSLFGAISIFGWGALI